MHLSEPVHAWLALKKLALLYYASMLAETRNPLSVDAAGRTQEYELVYSAEITLTDADGKWSYPQHIELA